MEHHTGFGQSSAHHAPDLDERCPQNTDSERTHTLTGDLPRMFALVQEFYEGEEVEESLTEVVAYGLTLPGGTAATFGADGHGFGRWTSAHSAARRFHSDLVWLGDGDMGKSTS